MATIKIGGTDYQIPEMNFLAIERAWPSVMEATSTIDPLKGPSAALAVFAAALMEADDFNQVNYGVPVQVQSDAGIHAGVTRFLKKKLSAKELGAVKDTMFQVLKEAGLEVTEGEILRSLEDALNTPAEDQRLSPETAPDTSLSSSLQDAKEAAGTG